LKVRDVAARYRKDVAVVFVHDPLPMHRFAQPAARAAECAAAQGRFWPMVDALYTAQDSLGLKPWFKYAQSASVPDSERFARCVQDTVAIPAIAAGLAMSRRLGISGTPTVLVNETRFGAPPSDSTLYATIDRLLRAPPR
jgi:protein-disulfide isomerase